MAEEFEAGICGGSWWNPSKSVFIGSSPCSAVNTASDVSSYGSWVTEMASSTRSCKDFPIPTNTNHLLLNGSDDDSSSPMAFQNPKQQHQTTDSDQSGGSGSILIDSTLQMMGFGISSAQWNNHNNTNMLRGRGESYNFMLSEDMNSTQQQKDWSPKSYTSSAGTEDFSLDHQQGGLNPVNSSTGNSTAACQGLSSGLSSCYGYPAAAAAAGSGVMQAGLFEPDPPQSLFNNRSINYNSSTTSPNYGTNLNEQLSPTNWPKLLSSPTFLLKPKQPLHQPNTLHFSNNTPFWNASAPTANLNDITTTFLPSSQPQLLVPNFEEKPTCPTLPSKANKEEVRESAGSLVKKGSSEQPSFKRPRIETPSPLPTFKVRKEKLGDRITALQQLVSPFGKTDTASVLYEAIEYIKLLHDQVLSTPYMKNSNHIQHQQNIIGDKIKDKEAAIQDLKSRGLCLVPISSTFPVASETTADFWTPTFGGTFR